ALGVLWAILQPVLTMVVFTIVFSKFGKIPSDGQPYPIFTFVALLPWQLFAYSLTHSSQSLVAEARVITKVYFPRLIIPISSVVAGLVDFGIALGILFILMLWYGTPLTTNLLFLPAFTFTALLSALAIGLWISALNVKYRDVRYIVPFVTQLWLFISPVAYSSNMVPERWQWLYGLNPMAGVIEGFRWSFLGTSPPISTIYASVAIMFVLFVGGLYYFRTAEKMFADLI
ncbi:MAG: ABC transporter permease, partial [Acidobacteriota bacterium]